MLAEDRLVWIDLEMTGLSDNDRIIEIASVVTDQSLEIVAVGPNIVIHQSDDIMGAMGSWCRKQHAKIGSRCRYPPNMKI